MKVMATSGLEMQNLQDGILNLNKYSYWQK